MEQFLPVVLIGCSALIGAGFAVLFMRRVARPQRPSGVPPSIAQQVEAATTDAQQAMLELKDDADAAETMETRLNILAVQLRTHVTSARWFSEMLLYKEYGKLNFAQMELLHQINDACSKGCSVLDTMFDNINVCANITPTDDPEIEAKEPEATE